MSSPGPDISEEKAERARSLEMVLQQAEEERARRVADDARGQSRLHLILASMPRVVLRSCPDKLFPRSVPCFSFSSPVKYPLDALLQMPNSPAAT